MRVESPFIHLVPRDLQANIEFRRWVNQRASGDPNAAKEFWIMAKRDPLFFVNTFMFTYDPRRDPSAIPFITYPFQDRAILTLCSALGERDVLIEKSRDMGASWINLTVFFWAWLTHDLQSFLMVSRKEDLVDKPGDPKSLFWKVDFALDRLPLWLRPVYTRTKLHLYNHETGSTLDGESTTGDVARGDRRTGILLDEFASVENAEEVLAATADATNCRFFNSTPKGTKEPRRNNMNKSIRAVATCNSNHREICVAANTDWPTPYPRP